MRPSGPAGSNPAAGENFFGALASLVSKKFAKRNAAGEPFFEKESLRKEAFSLREKALGYKKSPLTISFLALFRLLARFVLIQGKGRRGLLGTGFC